MGAYTLELKLNTKKQSDCNYLNNYFRETALISNTVRRFAIRQLTRLRRDPVYKALLKEYITIGKGPEKKNVSKQLSVIVKSYGLTKYDIQKSALNLRKNLKYVHSDVYQKLCDDVWKSVENILYSDGKKIHYKKWNEYQSFENKKNTTGIIYENGFVYINCTPKKPNGGIKLSVQLPQNTNSQHYQYETMCLCDKVKYCRIVRKRFASGWCYYVQLVLEGIPPQKHAKGTGRIGTDIGTSTVATVSDTKCHLQVIGDNLDVPDKEIRKLQRKLDRSKRVTNPENYNEDGTIKKGKKHWKYSRSYRKTSNKLASLQRKRAASLKQWQEAFADTLLEEGNEAYVEEMNFKGLAKRKKKTEKKKDGRYKSRKRFGKSVGTRAPAQLLAIIKRKLDYAGGTYSEVNTRTFKASQYNHVTDTYTKKKLSKRYNTINGEWIQRDLYSAFLLKCSDDTLEHADRNLCLVSYSSFKELHDKCMETILQSDQYIPSSFGIRKAA